MSNCPSVTAAIDERVRNAVARIRFHAFDPRTMTLPDTPDSTTGDTDALRPGSE